MRAMRAYLPVILVLLAVFAASCIIYIAWELSSDKPDAAGVNKDSNSEDSQ